MSASTSSLALAKIGGEDGALDVVFVHGLRGSMDQTWANSKAAEPEGGLWPKWMVADVGGISAYTVGYPASWFYRPDEQELNLYARANEILEVLASYSVGTRPMVFIAHSLGGLLVKQILRNASELHSNKWLGIAENVRGIFFVATPHYGAKLANALKFIAGEAISPHIESLQSQSDYLFELNISTRAICGRREIEVYSYYETRTLPVLGMIVDRESADPGIGANPVIAVEKNHLEITKPTSRRDPFYRSIIGRMSEITSRLQTPSPDGLGFISALDIVHDVMDKGDYPNSPVFLQAKGLLNQPENSAILSHQNGLIIRLIEEYCQIPRGIGQAFVRRDFSKKNNVTDAINYIKEKVGEVSDDAG